MPYDLWKALFDRSCDGLLELTGEGRVVGANATLLGWLGLPRQALVGHLLNRFVSPETAPPLPLRGPLWAGFVRLKGAQGGRLVSLTLTAIEGGAFTGVSVLGVARVAPDVMPLQEAIRRTRDELDTTWLVTINTLARMAEYHRPDIGGHLDRVRLYTYTLASSWAEMAEGESGLTEADIVELSRCAVLHDVGKVTIPERVLAKIEGLSDMEQSLLESHALLGDRILAVMEAELKRLLEVPATFLTRAREIVRSHHERWDGRGFPAGLRGEAIPLSARIVALADRYDVMTSRGAYQPELTHARARAAILAESGGQFDPQVVLAFQACEETFRGILDSIQLADSNPCEEAR
ncbi:MAG TPA: HD domain-containing phosphohydrolase [Symbiobacteriaceae bacterium]|nr:HD domain-containing phosphohydrolase [Symbiobacteriaceae bacterium]